MILNTLFIALWWLLPAGAANVTPIVVQKLPLLRNWSTPMDFGYSYRGQRLLGSHKTWRGVICGMVIATLVLWLQTRMAHHGWLPAAVTDAIPYNRLPVWLLGPLLGLGALGGDALESFFKRQRGIASGDTWLPFDQLDYIIGAVLVSLPFVILTLWQYIAIFVVWFGMHLLASYLGWRLGLKQKPL